MLTELGNKRKSQEFFRATEGRERLVKKNCSFSLFPCVSNREKRRNNNQQTNSAQKLNNYRKEQLSAS